MKRYKVKEVIKLLEADGWVLSYWKGDHRQLQTSNKDRESNGKRETKRHYNTGVIK